MQKKQKRHVGIFFSVIVAIIFLLTFLLGEDTRTKVYGQTINATGQPALQLKVFYPPTAIPTPTPRLLPTSTPAVSHTCGSNIVWLNSYSSGEFSPHFTDWVWSQCSQASLAEVLNAYKSPGSTLYRIGDVENRGLGLGVWNSFLGFLGPFQSNWQTEAASFGLKTDYRTYVPTLQNLTAVIAIANQGHPVIVGAPGHYLVIWGGDNQYVYTLDSSGHNFNWAPQSTNDSITLSGPRYIYKPTTSEFLHGLGGFADYWNGIAIILTPTSSTGCIQ